MFIGKNNNIITKIKIKLFFKLKLKFNDFKSDCNDFFDLPPREKYSD
jgi:predicted NUDIX family phosphoesterase